MILLYSKGLGINIGRVSMNAESSNLNKKMQLQIKKKETFGEGIDTLLALRKEMLKQIISFKSELNIEDFNVMPFINVKGYHNKNIAYSLYHMFRIEDIVAKTLIQKSTQTFFSENYIERMNSPIVTTGNELMKQEIAEFSSKLNLEELYHYIIDVDLATTKLLKELTYSDLKIKMTEEDKEMIKSLGVVSENENAVWLIDYWCGKNIKGLIQMPFSRHWIMHIEASQRIVDKIRLR
jgi:hypothetical protein